MDTITTQPPPLNLKTLPQPPPSIAELRHISAALSQFLRDYDDLHYHIGSVNSAIDEKLSVHFQGTTVNFNDFPLTPLIDSNTNNPVRNVLEGSVVERNPRGNVSECLFSDDDNVLEGVVSERKRNKRVSSDVDDDDNNNILEGLVSERKCNKCVRSDVRMHASSDSLIKDSDHRVVNDILEGVVVTEGKCEGSASDEDVKMYESANYVKKREESDCDGVVNDVLEGFVVTEGKCEESESESESERSDEDVRMYESTNYVKKSEESDCDRLVNDVLEGVFVTEGKYEGSVSESESKSESERSDEDVRMYESTNYVKKREEIDCDGVVNDVLEGVVSEEKPKGDDSDFKWINEDVKNEEIDASVKMEESDCEQSDYDVRMRQSPNSSDSCEETDDEDEEIGALKNAVPTCDEGEKIDAAKNVEETDYDPALNERMNELLEEKAVIEKNPIRTASKCDKVRTPQSSSSLENSEETDDEDGEIEASKKPEDADYDRFVTELLEDIDVVPKPNNGASKPQSPTFSKNHLDEIDVSVNPEDKNHEQTVVSMESGEIDILNTVETNLLETNEEMDIPKNPVETDVSEKPEEMVIPMDSAETDVSEKPEEIDIAKNPEETNVSEKPEKIEILKDPKPAVSELEWLCKSMSGREMKKYVVKHISDIDKLRKELLKALKLAINPAKLVLESIDTYFLQSSKTYNRGSYQYLNDQINERQASVLILECFVIINGDGIEISRKDEEYAAKAANLWKNRMIEEGGLRHIEEADARGLLLLISGFGICDRFNIVDIMELMRASNVKGISNILRRSIVLLPKIPEVIDTMVKNKLEVEAADIAYTFGLEYKCQPLTILTKFLRNVIDDIASGSPVLEATKQQLGDLRSLKECLESHNIDPSKVLPEFKIDEEIHHLKKKLKLQFEVQVEVQKRKAMDIESLPNPNHQDAKRTCFSHKTMPCGISSYNQSMRPAYSYLHFNPNRSSNPGGNIRPNGWQDESDCSPLIEMYLPRQSQTYESQLVDQYLPRQSQTYDSQLSSTGLYGRRPGFPVYMPGHPGYLGSFPPGGYPARRGPGSDLYGFADVVEKERHGSRAVGSGTARPSYFY